MLVFFLQAKSWLMMIFYSGQLINHQDHYNNNTIHHHQQQPLLKTGRQGTISLKINYTPLEARISTSHCKLSVCGCVVLWLWPLYLEFAVLHLALLHCLEEGIYLLFCRSWWYHFKWSLYHQDQLIHFNQTVYCTSVAQSTMDRYDDDGLIYLRG